MVSPCTVRAMRWNMTCRQYTLLKQAIVEGYYAAPEYGADDMEFGGHFAGSK